jgi:hypothetical protein
MRLPSTIGLLLCAPFTMEQVPSGVCALAESVAFPSYQIRSSDLSPKPCRGSPRDSIILFSSTKRAVAILLASSNIR